MKEEDIFVFVFTGSGAQVESPDVEAWEFLVGANTEGAVPALGELQ